MINVHALTDEECIKFCNIPVLSVRAGTDAHFSWSISGTVGPVNIVNLQYTPKGVDTSIE